MPLRAVPRVRCRSYERMCGATGRQRPTALSIGSIGATLGSQGEPHMGNSVYDLDDVLVAPDAGGHTVGAEFAPIGYSGQREAGNRPLDRR